MRVLLLTPEPLVLPRTVVVPLRTGDTPRWAAVTAILSAAGLSFRDARKRDLVLPGKQMTGGEDMIKTCKATCGLEGMNRGWLFAVSHSRRASRRQLQTACGRWFLITPRHCGYWKFVWAQRPEKFASRYLAREIFALSKYHSPYVLKRTYSLAAETSHALPESCFKRGKLWSAAICSSWSNPGLTRGAFVVFQRCSAAVVGSLQSLICPCGVHPKNNLLRMLVPGSRAWCGALAQCFLSEVSVALSWKISNQRLVAAVK